MKSIFDMTNSGGRMLSVFANGHVEARFTDGVGDGLLIVNRIAPLLAMAHSLAVKHGEVEAQRQLEEYMCGRVENSPQPVT